MLLLEKSKLCIIFGYQVYRKMELKGTEWTVLCVWFKKNALIYSGGAFKHPLLMFVTIIIGFAQNPRILSCRSDSNSSELAQLADSVLGGSSLHVSLQLKDFKPWQITFKIHLSFPFKFFRCENKRNSVGEHNTNKSAYAS